MDSSELQQLVSSVGDAILARLERGAARPPVACRLSKRQAAALIDHTILRPDATPADVRKVCREAIEYQFASVCVNGVFVPLVAAELAGSSVKVCSVVGFPLGAMPTKAKMAETELAIRAGASEIDMVLPVGLLKAGDLEAVKGDVAALAEVCARGDAILKVILETCLLNEYEKAVACVLSKLAGAHFVKTSTGFSKGGATKEDVALMRRVVGAEMGVKASGGIRTLDDLLAMVDAGASRIGASAGVQIVESIAC